MMMMRLDDCGLCKRSFPPELLSPFDIGKVDGSVESVTACPICALAEYNKVLAAQGCEAIDDFNGPRAKDMLRRARLWLSESLLDTTPLAEMSPTITGHYPGGTISHDEIIKKVDEA